MYIIINCTFMNQHQAAEVTCSCTKLVDKNVRAGGFYVTKHVRHH